MFSAVDERPSQRLEYATLQEGTAVENTALLL